MKFVKKRIPVDAFKLGIEYPEWFSDAVSDNKVTTHFESEGKVIKPADPFEDMSKYIVADIKTLEGTERADNGDYIIKGIHGELYPCKPDIFEETYEPAFIDKKPTEDVTSVVSKIQGYCDSHDLNAEYFHEDDKQYLNIYAYTDYPDKDNQALITQVEVNLSVPLDDPDHYTIEVDVDWQDDNYHNEAMFKDWLQHYVYKTDRAYPAEYKFSEINLIGWP